MQDQVDQPTTGPNPEVQRLLAEADDLAARGESMQAVDLIAEANRKAPHGGFETKLITLRRQAVEELESVPRAPWPPVHDDPFPEVVGVPPEVDAADLDGNVLGAAVAHHGSLIVRGLFSEEQVARSVAVIQTTEAHRDARENGAPGDRWYRPIRLHNMGDAALRKMIQEHGGTWMADSPAATARILDDLRAAGAIGAIADHFGERPLFSLQKSTLRRSAPINWFASYHQDGSFLGADARTMNVWVSLSHCGGDLPTPGLQLVPRRVDDILPCGSPLGRASIDEAVVAEAAGDTPPVCPLFAPGDALLFDERMVHRTHLKPDMTYERYAIECWFFAPAHFAEDYQAFIS